MQNKLYFYRALVTEAYDGDTITVNIDLGLKTHIVDEKIRLHRIDAPEVRGASRPAGLAARDFLRSIILNKQIVIETIKDRKGKYGRYLGEIWLPNENDEFQNINDLMVTEGHAVYKEY